MSWHSTSITWIVYEDESNTALESVAATEAFSEQHKNEARQSEEFKLYLKG